MVGRPMANNFKGSASPDDPNLNPSREANPLPAGGAVAESDCRAQEVASDEVRNTMDFNGSSITADPSERSPAARMRRRSRVRLPRPSDSDSGDGRTQNRRYAYIHFVPVPTPPASPFRCILRTFMCVRNFSPLSLLSQEAQFNAKLERSARVARAEF